MIKKNIKNLILGAFIENVRTPLVALNHSKLEKEIIELIKLDHEIYDPANADILLSDKTRARKFLLDIQIIPKPYYFIEEDPNVLGTVPFAFDNKGDIILEILPQNPISFSEAYKQVNLSIFLTQKFFGKKSNAGIDVEDIVILSHAYSHNYYHFIADSLLKLVVIHEAIKNGSVLNPKFVISSSFKTWHFEYLELLGIKKENILVANRDCIRARRLLVPSPRRYRHCHSRQAIEFFKSTIYKQLKILNHKPFRRIYISRKKANSRQLLNEDKLLKELFSFGFEVVFLEELSVREQIQIFSEAQLVCAPHGAGLANLIYCNPPRLIELLPYESYGLGHYLGLCVTMSGQYRCVIGSVEDKNYNFSIDIDKTTTLVDDLLNHVA